MAWAQPTDQDTLARAQSALDMGRPNQALKMLDGTSLAQRILRMKALLKAHRPTEALAILRQLEATGMRHISSPWDVTFYLKRGQLEALLGQDELARKNYTEALKRAISAEQKLTACDHFVEHYLDKEETQSAKEWMNRSQDFLSQTQNIWRLQEHLKITSRFLKSEGQVAAAEALNRSIQELYLSRGNKLQALRLRLAETNFDILSANLATTLEEQVLILTQLLELKDFQSLPGCLQNMSRQSARAGQSAQARVTQHYYKALKHIPEGRDKNSLRLALVNHLWLVGGSDSEITDILGHILQSEPELSNSCRAHQKMADQWLMVGRYDQAMESLERALKLARPHLKADRDWPASPGPTLLRMARVEFSRHRYPEAIKLAAEAVAAQPGKDWALWRARARRERLKAAMQVADVEVAGQEFQACLAELSAVQRLSWRVDGTTSLFADLFLNKVHNQAVVDPGPIALGEYDPVSRQVLKAALKDPEVLHNILQAYEQWQAQSRLRQESYSAFFPGVYKGMILESVGRLTEAKASVERAINQGPETQNKMAHLHARLILARIAKQQGQQKQSLEHIAKAADLSSQLTPEMAGVYHLIAASAHRDSGRLSVAQQLYSKAIQLDPERAWSGYYGQALTSEKQKTWERGLVELAKAEEVLPPANLLAKALVMSCRGRLTHRAQGAQKALPIYRLAHNKLHALGAKQALSQMSLDMGDCLLELKRDQEALDLTCQTLDTTLQGQNISQTTEQALIERAVTLALKLGDKERALHYLQLSHSSKLLRALSNSDPAADSDTLLASVERLKQRVHRLEKQAAQADSEAKRHSLGQVLTNTREDFFSKLSELRAKEPEFEALVQMSALELSAVQDRLKSDAALIQYFPAKETLYLFVVTKGEFSLHEVSLSRIELESLIASYLDQLTNPDATRSSEIGQRLYRLLLSSAEVRLKSVQQLRIVPVGALWRVPFASLGTDKNKPLGQRFEVSYLTSADLVNTPGASPKFSQASKPLLISGSRELTGVDQETRRLLVQFPRAKLINQAPNFPELAQLLSGRDLVHIASHSSLSSDAEQSYIQMGEGKLTLRQIFGLNLQKGSLVVLSSCRSAVGVGQNGKEVTSLASAFGIAGASSVIASDWRVDDQATSLFFEFFYQALLSGKSRAASLGFAQEKMRAQKPHPFFWAGFRLLGDPG